MNQDKFRKEMYMYIRDRTEDIRGGSKRPFVGWRSAKVFGKKRGFGSKPTFLTLKELLDKGAIYSKYEPKTKQYRYIAKI